MNLIKNYFIRALFFIVGDTLSLIGASVLSFLIISSFADTSYAFPWVPTTLIVCLSLIGLALANMYQVSWRFTSLRELLMIVLALTSGSAAFLGISLLTGSYSGNDFAFTSLVLTQSILLVGGFRISKRMMHEVLNTPRLKKRAVVFGAGSAGDQIMRDVMRHNQWNLNVAAIFDDEESLHGLTLHGVEIMGGRKRMYSYLRYSTIDELIIAIPSLPKREFREVIDRVHEINPKLKVKVLPSFHMLSDDPVGVKNIREISIEDVLGREPARIDMESIHTSIAGKRVLVTGAGGSIGSEIVRQCVNLGPAKLIALDVDETELFHLLHEFDEGVDFLEPCVANITDKNRMDRLMEREKPDVIFHAAAYKHVPMMESFPEEAVKVNIGGTRIIARLACEHNVDKFVLISTDKAVNPTNVMGATKRVAEEICLSYNDLCITKFISVRFGNVLGSRGSVVPLFIEQIKNGGPVTITDPEVKRYFMTIPEAVLLVMQAGAMGDGGEVFVLDMGEPIRILDMARELIRLHGLEPVTDIPIEFRGLRPGEKMFEELLNAEEGVEPTGHELIYKAICSRELSNEELNTIISHLFHEIRLGSEESIRYLLRQLVPTFTWLEAVEGASAEPVKPELPATANGSHLSSGRPNGNGLNGKSVQANGTKSMNGVNGTNGHAKAENENGSTAKKGKEVNGSATHTGKAGVYEKKELAE